MVSIVTGGCGFIGSHIVDKLISIGHEVRVIDDLSAQENERFYYNDQATYCQKDISKDDCSNIFSGVDYVFHLAARSRIQPTIGSPNECFEVNVVGTQRVLEWSRLNSVKRVIYSGTSSLYGKQNTMIKRAEELGVSPDVMKGAWDKNKQVRKDLDWYDIPGAVSISKNDD